MDIEAAAYFQKSEYINAHSMFTSIVKSTANKDPWNFAAGLINIAEIDLVTAKPEAEVYCNIEKAQEIFTAMRVSSGIDYCRLVLADLKLREGNIADAKILFQQGLNSHWGKNSEVVNYALERLADVICWTPDEMEWSSRWTVVYLAQATKSQKKVALYKALQFIGDRFMLLGETDTAHSLFEVALAEFTQLDIHQRRAACMLRLGDIAKERGLMFKAIGLWQDARPLFERCSQANEVANIDTRLAAVDVRILQQHEELLQYLSTLDAPTTSLDTGTDQLNVRMMKDMDPSLNRDMPL
ncbi:hypothetical protein FB451DRAFT_1400684 [Mycena latifolia]|nr:hypothetical protein FB451DRAFT_1400684 [Mycena latifolia]